MSCDYLHQEYCYNSIFDESEDQSRKTSLFWLPSQVFYYPISKTAVAELSYYPSIHVNHGCHPFQLTRWERRRVSPKKSFHLHMGNELACRTRMQCYDMSWFLVGIWMADESNPIQVNMIEIKQTSRRCLMQRHIVG